MSRPGLLYRSAISRPEGKVCITQDIGTVARRPGESRHPSPNRPIRVRHHTEILNQFLLGSIGSPLVRVLFTKG
jgi:hypothetical protein